MPEPMSTGRIPLEFDRPLHAPNEESCPLRCLHPLKETLCSGACKSDIIHEAWVRLGNQKAPH